MSNLNQFLGQSRPPKSIVNRYSGGGVSKATLSGASSTLLKEILSGALTANGLKTMLSVSGAGAVKSLIAYTKDATARTIRLKVTIDGASVFDATSNSIAASGTGITAIGATYYSADHLNAYENVPFNSSLTVELASSLDETDKAAIGIAYEMR